MRTARRRVAEVEAQVQLGTDLVGRRVVLRSIVAGERGPSGGPALTDVIGRVRSYESGRVLVEKRDGSTVEVDLSTVVSARAVPDGLARVRPRPATDFEPDELSRICTRGWPPTNSRALGEWELRAAGGFTGRANSVAVHGDPGRPFGDALADVIDFYDSYALPPRAQVVAGSLWESRFEGEGWSGISGARDHAVVQVADLRTVLEHVAPADERVAISAALTPQWLGMLERGTDFPAADLEHVLQAPATVGFVQVGEPIAAIARVVVTGEWAGLSCVHTAPAARRTGLATAVTDASMRWAADHGADKVYLQTMRTNTTALRFYARYGFVEHHTYRYLRPPPP